MTPSTPYIGRFAPSPTGALHAGSLVAALASWLDARAHGGTWLVRIEDVDTPRCTLTAQRAILRQLQQHGLLPDAVPLIQSQRGPVYQQALDALTRHALAYPCGCSRKAILEVLATQGRTPPRHGEMVYPGICHPRNGGLHGQLARAWRLDVRASLARSGLAETVCWHDRRLGTQSQNVAQAVGDFVLHRADGLWAYQLVVVVDDAAQSISHIVRGEDLADNTARQIVLQQALGLPTPRYLHTPLVLAASGEKLSKQNGAQPLAEGDAAQTLANLGTAAAALGLAAVPAHASLQEALAQWVGQWAALYNGRPKQPALQP